MSFIASFEKTALSKNLLTNAAKKAQEKIQLAPPGLRHFPHVKPVGQYRKFMAAADKK